MANSLQTFDVIGFGAMNVDFIVQPKLEPSEEFVILRSSLVSEAERPISDLPRFVGGVAIARGESAGVQSHGGSAFNTLKALRNLNLGLRLGFVGAVGRYPAELGIQLPSREHALQSLDIASPSFNDYGGPGGYCLSIVEKTDRTLRTYYDPKIVDHFAENASEIAEYISRANVVHVTSIFGSGAAEVTASIVTLATEINPELVVSFDPGHVWASDAHEDVGVQRLLARANYIFANSSELGRLRTDRADQHEQGSGLLEESKQARSIVLYKQWDRSVIFRRDDNLSIDPITEFVNQSPLPPSRVVDPTGAGDVFAAGFLAGMHSNRGHFYGAVHVGLDAAREKLQHLGGEGYEALESIFTGGLAGPGGKVFISHAAANKDQVAVLTNLLSLAGLHGESDIFCSSDDARGVRLSADWLAEIHRKLNECEMVVALITPEFLARQMCLFEIGAAWILNKRTYVIVADDIDTDLLHPLLQGHQYGKLDKQTFRKLYEATGRVTRVKMCGPARWESLVTSAFDQWDKLGFTNQQQK
jgi:sugar/nucleoside kinase (ribokinase family)